MLELGDQPLTGVFGDPVTAPHFAASHQDVWLLRLSDPWVENGEERAACSPGELQGAQLLVAAGHRAVGDGQTDR